MRDKKRWSALVLAVIMVAALSLTGCRKEREKINITENTENNTLVSTESESETETATEKVTEPVSEKTTESETTAPDANNTQQTEPGNTPDNTITPDASNNGGTTNNTGNNGGNTGNNGGDATGGNTDGDNTGNNGGTTGGDNTGNNGGEGTGDGSTVTTEAPRYFFGSDGSRVDVTQMPDGSWQDANGISYTFYENGVKDSNGVQYYYDPPANGNTSVEVGTQADFYDTQGNHIVCTMDENGNWVDSEGNTYVFGEDGVTDSSGNFHPY